MKTLLLVVIVLLTCPVVGLAEGDLPQNYKAQILRDLGATGSNKRPIITIYKPADALIEAGDGKAIRAKVVLVHFTPRNDKGAPALMIVNMVYVWIGPSGAPKRRNPNQVEWIDGEPKPDGS